MSRHNPACFQQLISLLVWMVGSAARGTANSNGSRVHLRSQSTFATSVYSPTDKVVALSPASPVRPMASINTAPKCNWDVV